MNLPNESSIHVLFARLRLFYKDAHAWRLTHRIPGEIQGLPTTAGILVATNGVLCLIERQGQDHFEGHLDWFVPLHQRYVDDIMCYRVEKKPTAAKKTETLNSEYVAELML